MTDPRFRQASNDAIHTEGASRVVRYVTGDGLESGAGSGHGSAGVPVSTIVVPSLFDGGTEATEVWWGLDDDVVILPSVGPFDERGAVAHGDLVAQTRQAFANAAALLADLGLSMANVTMTVDYLTLGGLKQYKGTGEVRREFLSPPYPGSAGIIMERMAHPDAMMSLDVMASRSPLEGINPGWERYAKLTYLPAVRAGATLFMSGQAALDPPTETAVHVGDVVAQTAYTYANIVAVLDAAGLGPESLVQCLEYYTPAGADRRDECAAVRRETLGGHDPVVTQMPCTGLLRREFEIEVIPMAVVG